MAGRGCVWVRNWVPTRQWSHLLPDLRLRSLQNRETDFCSSYSRHLMALDHPEWADIWFLQFSRSSMILCSYSWVHWVCWRDTKLNYQRRIGHEEGSGGNQVQTSKGLLHNGLPRTNLTPPAKSWGIIWKVLSTKGPPVSSYWILRDGCPLPGT